MKRSLVMGIAGAFAFAAVAGSALAAPAPSSTVQKCEDGLQNSTLKYINAVQKVIRGVLKNNIAGKDSLCSGGFACSGANNHGKTCSTNAYCLSGGVSQCAVNVAKGAAGAVIKAKAGLRSGYAKACTTGDLGTLGFPNSRCPNATTTTLLADCVLQGAIGDFTHAIFGDPAGEIMGRAATDLVPDPGLSGALNGVCGLTMGSILQIGALSTSNTPAEAGGAQPLDITALSCGTQPCDTTGRGTVGNNLTAPTQTYAGTIPICLVTVTSDAGGGKTQTGTIDTVTGEQHSFAPISTTVVFTVCPICNSGLCDSGVNASKKCSASGSQDIACPPSTVGGEPVIPNPLNLSTESLTLSVPANNPGGGATNPSGSFCGACDGDTTIGCQNDSECTLQAVCGGVGCCQFSTSPGAFGQAVTSINSTGKRGPYVPQLGTVFCTGKSGDPLVDPSQGLPGPVRLVQSQVNNFEYAP